MVRYYMYFVTLLLLYIVFTLSAVINGHNENKTCTIQTDEIITSANINQFENCIHVKGNIYITNKTFVDFHPDKLIILKSIKTIKGHIAIEAFDHRFTNLFFLENLKSVHKENDDESPVSVLIRGTSLQSIYLPKLKQISSSIIIQNNTDLCYSDQWLHNGIINDDNIDRSVVRYNNDNTLCCCNKHCNGKTCWGTAANQCNADTNSGITPSVCEDEATQRPYSQEGAKTTESEKTTTTHINEMLENEFHRIFVCLFIVIVLLFISILLSIFIICKTIIWNNPYDPIPKHCKGNKEINSTNIITFRGCQVINGDINISNNTFNGMRPRDLEALSNVTTITGYVNIDAWHEDFRNLAFLRNLVSIGINVSRYSRTLNIEKSSLRSLKMQSLKQIYGIIGVLIINNKDLCYVDSIDWNRMAIIASNKVENNRNIMQCKEDGYDCDPLCSEDGCWGDGSDQCLTCDSASWRDEKNCVVTCPTNKFPRNGTCTACDPKCKAGCSGPGITDCENLKQEIVHNETCNSTWQYSRQYGCISCNIECKYGCTDSGANKCNSCKHVKDGENCISKCPESKFNMNGKCSDCNIECKDGCTGQGANNCNSCKHVKDGENCISKCPESKFNMNGKCSDCNIECKDGCAGQGANNCNSCKHVKDGENCILNCPEEKLNMSGVCQSCDSYNDPTNKDCPQQKSSNTVLIFSIAVAIVSIIILLFIGLCFFYCQRKSSICRKNGKTHNMEKDEMQPLSGKLNDFTMAQLTIIKESEIRKLQILGSGAFGKVYEAIWQPEGTSDKISVAVKVLHQNSSVDSVKDFLDEAVVMASMDHSNIVHLIAICVTTEIMLLTKLMPLGCLLNYVRINKQHISPKSLLTWITQIAKGMVYLEQKHLVHRDLAARNVLLETVDCIKISDFGLSKFVGTADFSSSNTKFPIKWLALECLEEKLFTHKSDVWAFGVTSWELLTFGDRPFDQVKGRELVKQLKLGSKLRQPPISSADVYATLLRCWLLKPELRPDFNELEITFRKMSYEPSKYLTSHGNAHFKKLNHIPQESRLSSDSTIRNSATHPLKNNYLYSPIATHSNNQINSNRSYLRNDSKGQQIQTIKLTQLRPAITIYSEQEDYLIPTTQQTSDSNDSGYDTIVHV